VYFVFPEKGVMNVQPLIVNVLLGHLVKKTFFLLAFTALFAEYQNDSGYLNINGQDINLLGTNDQIL